ncbi:Wzz/FepE/Etk N-terminal domain-containing protein [Atopobiaceae bacterium HCP3S3_F7]
MTLLELLQLLKRHLRLVVVLPVACALVMGAYSVLLMHDTYTASTSQSGSVGNVGVMALPVWHEEAVLDPELLPLSYADSIPSASSRLASIALRAVSLSSASLSGVGGRDGLLSFESSAILSSEK